MKPFLQTCGLLLRAVGLLLGGSRDCPRRDQGASRLGVLDLMKLRSWHVDPFRSGNHFPWTRRDD
jgi:hypothetical protein